VVRVEDLGLVQAERLDDVLVGVGVDRLLEGLPQKELPALGAVMWRYVPSTILLAASESAVTKTPDCA